MLTLPQTIATVIGAFDVLAAHLRARQTTSCRCHPGAWATHCDICFTCDGQKHDQDFQNYHRVLNRARWSTLRGGRILL
jgi:hypothetical protein